MLRGTALPKLPLLAFIGTQLLLPGPLRKGDGGSAAMLMSTLDPIDEGMGSGAKEGAGTGEGRRAASVCAGKEGKDEGEFGKEDRGGDDEEDG
ncbi:hypothetical protein DFJ73DRAFT_822253 [Zopfochytrium polystomum]|nr:hypothetical protein DFJ73DRAFT_822253 [Zopfochytrium polystomum]